MGADQLSRVMTKKHPAIKLPLRQKLCLLISQGINALFYDGDPSESLSGRAWRLAEDSEEWERRVHFIDRCFSPGHCERVHLTQQARDRLRK
jgi:hypothetical protein